MFGRKNWLRYSHFGSRGELARWGLSKAFTPASASLSAAATGSSGRGVRGSTPELNPYELQPVRGLLEHCRETSYEGSGEGMPAPSSQAKPRPASFLAVDRRPVYLDKE